MRPAATGGEEVITDDLRPVYIAETDIWCLTWRAAFPLGTGHRYFDCCADAEAARQRMELCLLEDFACDPEQLTGIFAVHRVFVERR